MPPNYSEQHEKQERDALDFIRARAAAGRVPPTVQEIAEHLGLKHANSGLRVVTRLERAGLIDRSAGHRCIRLALVHHRPPRPLSLPLRGSVSCGPLREAEDDDDELDLAAMFKRDDLAAFKAAGTSMIDDGIRPGDFLIVRECPEPETGDKVVALLDRDMVCKKYHTKRNGMVELRPCNPGVPPIEVDPSRGHFRILGVLHFVLRKV